jgi:integrase/recombinase XerD
MNKSQQVRFESLYAKHVSALKRQGKADKTIEVYARAVRRVAQCLDCCPDKLTQQQLEAHFDALVASHSWSTVKVDRNGLQFFYEHVLKRPWTWVDIVKPPQVRVLPDILTLKEIERLINGTRELRYQTFILVAFSMGLRLGEVLCLQVGDIDRICWALPAEWLISDVRPDHGLKFSRKLRDLLSFDVARIMAGTSA